MVGPEYVGHSADAPHQTHSRQTTCADRELVWLTNLSDDNRLSPRYQQRRMTDAALSYELNTMLFRSVVYQSGCVTSNLGPETVT